MKTAIPCLYASYGRYLDAYRALPSNIDGLKISLRRALLSLYDMAKDKYVKSARVTGHMIGTYHPHGDLSAYETVFTLVLQNYAIGEGGWGSKDKDGTDSPSAPRYTECKLSPWVRDSAFRYIKYVPWVNLELDDEPVYLPCPIPIGLIGCDNITGISFHRTVIPKYKKEDLAKRLKWLIEIYNEHDGYPDFNSQEEMDEDKFGPLIKPNFRDCKSKENETGEYYRLLFHGTGNIRVIPNGTIKNNKIYIKGRVPGSSFNHLLRHIDDGKLDFNLVDLSGNGEDPYELNVELTPKRKKDDIKKMFTELWTKYLVKNINYQCYFVNDESLPEVLGIDSVLINNYSHYLNVVLKYRVEVFEKANNRLFDNHIILIIKELINKYDIKTLDDLITQYNHDYPEKKKIKLQKFENDNFSDFEREINEDDLVNICNKNSITKLITVKVDINKIQNDIKEAMQSIQNIYDDCYHEVCKYVKE